MAYMMKGLVQFQATAIANNFFFLLLSQSPAVNSGNASWLGVIVE
jgi:hypothetical protein